MSIHLAGGVLACMALTGVMLCGTAIIGATSPAHDATATTTPGDVVETAVTGAFVVPGGFVVLRKEGDDVVGRNVVGKGVALRFDVPAGREGYLVLSYDGLSSSPARATIHLHSMDEVHGG